MKKVTSVKAMTNLFTEKGSKILAILDTDGSELPVNFIPKRKQKIKWVCAKNEDHISTSGLECVIRGERDLFLCRKCAISKARGLTYDEICKKIEEENYTLVTSEKDYSGVMKPIIVRCNNKHEYETTWNRFSSAEARCPTCYNNNRKVPTKDIRKVFSDLGYKITDGAVESYVDNKTPIECICTCGRTFSIAYSNAFRRKEGTCKECTRRWKIIDVSDYMEDVGCEFISVDSEEFVLNSNKITYICYCGTEYTAPWRSFKEGSRCNNCTKQIIRATCLEKYGVDNPSKSEQIKKAIISTTLENHGVEYAMQKKEFAQKCIETNKKNHGGIHNLNLPETREDADRAFTDKYGESFGYVEEHRKQSKNTNMQNLGVSYPLESEEIREKGVKTKIERYGTSNTMEIPGVLSKALRSAFSSKEYVYPSGKIIRIQGYEMFALDRLIKEGVSEDRIITNCDEVPFILYNDGEINRRYVPDIWIPSINTIIEVKSDYTYTKDLERNMIKFKAVVDAKYKFELWVFDAKGYFEMKGVFIGDIFARFISSDD